MNTEEKSTTKRTGAKVLACLLAVLLMVGIAFLVATLVHKNSAQPVSNIKNGLSAYELAVANGYDGSVDEWLTSLKGKSAYDIAVENGYKGTEKEWVKSVEANGKQKQAGISTAKFNDSGDLMITLTDGTVSMWVRWPVLTVRTAPTAKTVKTAQMVQMARTAKTA